MSAGRGGSYGKAGGMPRRDAVKLLAGAVAAGAVGVPALCDIAGAALGVRYLEDALGRRVRIPVGEDAPRIAFADAAAEMLGLALAPERAAMRLDNPQSGSTDAYRPEAARDLPAYVVDISDESRTWMRDEKVGLVVSVHCYGSADEHAAWLDALQETTGVPSLCLAGDIDGLSQALLALGRVLGRTGRARQLVGFSTGIRDGIRHALGDIAEGDRTRVLYVADDFGHAAYSFKRPFAHALELAGCANAASEDEADAGGNGNADGLLDVSRHMAEGLDVNYILGNERFTALLDDMLAHPQAAAGSAPMLRDSIYASMPAVSARRYRCVPDIPSSWLAAPQGLVSLLGMQWICHLLYPQRYDIDMKQAVRDFFATVWNVELAGEQLQALGWSDM